MRPPPVHKTNLNAGLLAFAGLLLAALSTSQPNFQTAKVETTFIRVNLVGYLPGDAKVAIAFSDAPLEGIFRPVNDSTQQNFFTRCLR